MVYLFPRMQWVLTPSIRRTLPLKRQMERRQKWLSANLLSSPYLNGDLVKSYCQYQKRNWATFSFVSRDKFNFQKGSYFWEKKIVLVSLFFCYSFLLTETECNICSLHTCPCKFPQGTLVMFWSLLTKEGRRLSWVNPHYDISLQKHRDEKQMFSQAIITPIQMPNW